MNEKLIITLKPEQDKTTFPRVNNSHLIEIFDFVLPHPSKSGLMHLYGDRLTGDPILVEKIFGYSAGELRQLRRNNPASDMGRAGTFTQEQAESLASDIDIYNKQLQTIGIIVPSNTTTLAQEKPGIPNEWIVNNNQSFVPGVNLKDRLSELLKINDQEAISSYFGALLNITHTTLTFRPSDNEQKKLFLYQPVDSLESCIAIDIKPSNFLLFTSQKVNEEQVVFVDLVYPGNRNIDGSASYTTHVPNANNDPGVLNLTQRLSTFEGLVAKLILEFSSIGKNDNETVNVYKTCVQKTVDFFVDKNDKSALERFQTIADQHMSFYKNIQGLAEEKRFHNVWSILSKNSK